MILHRPTVTAAHARVAAFAQAGVTLDLDARSPRPRPRLSRTSTWGWTRGPLRKGVLRRRDGAARRRGRRRRAGCRRGSRSACAFNRKPRCRWLLGVAERFCLASTPWRRETPWPSPAFTRQRRSRRVWSPAPSFCLSRWPAAARHDQRGPGSAGAQLVASVAAATSVQALASARNDLRPGPRRGDLPTRRRRAARRPPHGVRQPAGGLARRRRRGRQTHRQPRRRPEREADRRR